MSRRVVEVLWENDPVFRMLATDVVGVSDVDGFVDAVYGGDVSKMSPEPSEVGYPSGEPLRRRRRRRRRVDGAVEKGKTVDAVRLVGRGVDAARRGYRKVAEPVARQVGVTTGHTVGPMRAATSAGGVWDRTVSQNKTFRDASKWAALGAGGIGAVALGQKGKKLLDEANLQRNQVQMVDPDEYPGTLGKSDDPSLDALVEFSKVDSDKRQVFGWASVTHRNCRPVIDKQGDFIELDEALQTIYDPPVSAP